MISAYGIVAPFWINAISNLAIVGVVAVVARRRNGRHAAAGRALRPGHVGRPSLCAA